MVIKQAIHENIIWSNYLRPNNIFKKYAVTTKRNLRRNGQQIQTKF